MSSPADDLTDNLASMVISVLEPAPEAVPEILLGALQPVDLKKVLEKMERVEHCKLHRSAKWVHLFLETNMGRTLIGSDKSLYLVGVVAGRQNSTEHVMRRRQANGDIEEIPINSSAAVNKPLNSKNKFIMKAVYISTETNKWNGVPGPDIVQNRISDDYPVRLVESGVNRVEKVVLRGIRPVDKMFDLWKPTTVEIKYSSVHGEGYWSNLSGGSPTPNTAYPNSDENSSFEEGIDKLQKRCETLNISNYVDEPNETLLPRIVKQIEKFSTNRGSLKRLCLAVSLRDEPDLEKYFPEPFVPDGKNTTDGNPIRTFVYPGENGPATTFTEITWWSKTEDHPIWMHVTLAEI